MYRVRSVGAVLSALMLAGVGGCCLVAASLFKAEADFNLAQDANDVTALKIDWTNGTVTFAVSGEATRITATGKKRVRAATQEMADAALADITISLAPNGTDANQVDLKFTAPSGTLNVYGADVDVVVPAGLELNIESDNGIVTVTGNQGSTTVELDNGTVTVTQQVGNTNVDVDNGTVTVESREGDLIAKTDNGTVDVEARPNVGGTVSASSSVGSVSIQVPADFAASLALQVEVGIVIANLDEFTATDTARTLRKVTATLNGGGGTITGDTDVGDVRFGALD